MLLISEIIYGGRRAFGGSIYSQTVEELRHMQFTADWTCSTSDHERLALLHESRVTLRRLRIMVDFLLDGLVDSENVRAVAWFTTSSQKTDFIAMKQG